MSLLFSSLLPSNSPISLYLHPNSLKRKKLFSHAVFFLLSSLFCVIFVIFLLYLMLYRIVDCVFIFIHSFFLYFLDVMSHLGYTKQFYGSDLSILGSFGRLESHFKNVSYFNSTIFKRHSILSYLD